MPNSEKEKNLGKICPFKKQKVRGEDTGRERQRRRENMMEKNWERKKKSGL
jgi:hypothetical protein